MFVDEPVADLMNVIVAVVHLGVLVEEQEPEQASHPQCWGSEARGAVEDARAAAAHPPGETEGVQQP